MIVTMGLTIFTLLIERGANRSLHLTSWLLEGYFGKEAHVSAPRPLLYSLRSQRRGERSNLLFISSMKGERVRRAHLLTFREAREEPGVPLIYVLLCLLRKSRRRRSPHSQFERGG